MRQWTEGCHQHPLRHSAFIIHHSAFSPIQPQVAMNFRTTVILLAVLLVVGVAVFFVARKGDDTEGQTNKKKLVDLADEDVTRVVITRAGDPQRIVFERPAKTAAKAADSPFGPPPRDWRMLEPV